ncbi:MAG TPA: hypothetical protein VG267_10860 [Terracidiphilus sp.]|jgi:hypothetical protein|nr:hypothetical protein [Terracidiphilus sp.]
MSDCERQLASFLDKYAPDVAALARATRARMRALYPSALELVYDNYNALAIGYAPSEKTSEAIFSVALFPRWVSLFFLQAQGLPDPTKLLKGSGNVAKHVVLPSVEALDHPALRQLMAEAVSRAKVPFPADSEHRLIIKSISAKQRPRRPAATIKSSHAKRTTAPRTRQVSARG